MEITFPVLFFTNEASDFKFLYGQWGLLTDLAVNLLPASQLKFFVLFSCSSSLSWVLLRLDTSYSKRFHAHVEKSSFPCRLTFALLISFFEIKLQARSDSSFSFVTSSASDINVFCVQWGLLTDLAGHSSPKSKFQFSCSPRVLPCLHIFMGMD
jgi:hypothetical protein